MHVGIVAPKDIPPAVCPFGPHRNPNMSCAFHGGYIGHTVEDYFVFKNRVQDLIDQNIFPFTEENPNVKSNPLMDHGNQTMNTVIEEDGTELVHLVKDVKTPWSSISLSMQRHCALVGVHDSCEMRKTGLKRYEELKDCVQELMDQGVLQFSRDGALREVLVIEPIEIIYHKK